ncbi:MAG TPA: hypothetical protein VK727_09545 [Steroidobacteraceae bacterium]|nr:hypothetical protein [Steroidobacteraceae bacterium]
MSGIESKKTADQSARFIEAAKELGADETGKKFERAFKKVVKAKPKASRPALKG